MVTQAQFAFVLSFLASCTDAQKQNGRAALPYTWNEAFMDGKGLHV